MKKNFKSKKVNTKVEKLKKKYGLLFHIVRLSEARLQEEAAGALIERFGYKDVEVYKPKYIKEGYVYAKGSIPVCLVAHVDTVHEVPVKTIVLGSDYDTVTSPEGFGGDDRCGVYMALTLLKMGLRPHVLFVCGEEIGCIGSGSFCERHPNDLGINWFLQFDRRNSNDVVRYSDDNPELIREIEKYGFVEARGSCSDISNLCPHFGVSGVNLSCGYYHEHHFDTSVKLSEMDNVIDRAYKILTNEELVNRRIEYKEKIYNYSYYDYEAWRELLKYENSKYNTNEYSSKDYCLCCGIEGHIDGSELIDTEYGPLCKNCLDIYLSSGDLVECPHCGSYVAPDVDLFGRSTCAFCGSDLKVYEDKNKEDKYNEL